MDNQKKQQLKERLCSQVFVAMVAVEFCELPIDDVIQATESAIGAYRNTYRGNIKVQSQYKNMDDHFRGVTKMVYQKRDSIITKLF